jgi:hypothetical protein
MATMIVGCYSLDLYCSIPRPQHLNQWIDIDDVRRGKFPMQFTGATERQCKAKARKQGWIFKGGDVICPDCAARRKP